MHQLSSTLQEALADRYLVERELGRGGMATVYQARDLRHDRLVAIKVLRPELGLALGGERFLREIRLTARLRHPHILPVFDSGALGAELWYVMPYVEGGSLRSRMQREGQLPVDDAVALSRQILAALAYSHREGIVHRDIKPENVLLEADEAVVADFGIARALHEAGGERLTETGLSLGTPGYMSPEQVTGESGVDGRADVYAVGCILFEMLAGRPPFIGATAQAVIAQKLISTPPPIRSVAPRSTRRDGCVRRARPCRHTGGPLCNRRGVRASRGGGGTRGRAVCYPSHR